MTRRPPTPARAPRRVSPAPRVALAALTLALPAAAGDDPDYVLQGCAELVPGGVQLQASYDGCTSGIATASFVAPVQGRYTVDVDWVTGVGAGAVDVRVVVDGTKVFSDSEPSTCGGCSGGTQDVPVLVQAGDTVEFQAVSFPLFGGSVQATFSGLEFEPDVGLITLGGGLDGALLHVGPPTDGISQTGAPLAVLDDIDGDGHADWAVGSLAEGVVRVLSGVGHGLVQTLPAVGVSGSQSLAAVGDVDGDGREDLLVGTPHADGFHGGGAQLWSADGTLLHEWTESGQGQLGFAVSAAGDVDLDGVPDVALGRPLANQPGSATGVVRILSGATGELLRVLSSPQGSRFGSSLDLLGDMDLDGFDDLLLVAAVHGAPGSVVELRAGADGDVLHAVHGKASGSNAGVVVARAGDVDADGTPVYVIGRGLAQEVPGVSVGEAVVHGGADHEVLFARQGEVGSWFGRDVSAAGDLDGDGFDDVAVGAPFEVGAGEGRLRVYGGSDGELLLEQAPPFPGLRLGTTIVGGRDLDGDGQPDLLVSQALPDPQPFEPSGLALILSGDLARHVEPVLQAAGPLLPDTALELTLVRGPAHGVAWLVFGASALELPFLGGVLVPSVDLVVAAPLDARGALQATVRWPDGLPALFPVWMQAWMPAASGPAGWLASNAVQAITPE